MKKPLQPGFRPRENRSTALAGVGNASPFGGWRHHLARWEACHMTYDTESKSRNILASPLGEEGHEVAKGWTRERMIMICYGDVTAERRHYNTHCP